MYDIIWVGSPRVEVKRRLLIGQCLCTTYICCAFLQCNSIILLPLRWGCNVISYGTISWWQIFMVRQQPLSCPDHLFLCAIATMHKEIHVITYSFKYYYQVRPYIQLLFCYTDLITNAGKWNSMIEVYLLSTIRAVEDRVFNKIFTCLVIHTTETWMGLK